ncbi:MAG: hypothetical protein AAFY38_09210 [Pseudomonadota bacterium]
MTAFSYRPAALRGDTRVEHDADGLRVDDGPMRHWAALNHACFAVSMGGRELSFVTLALEFQDGAREVLSVTGPAAVQRVFFTDLRGVLADLAQARPLFEVSLGPTGIGRSGMFITAVLLAMVGVGLTVLAFFVALEGEIGTAVVMGPVGLVALAAGVRLAVGHAPGTAPERIRVEDLVRQIEANAAVAEPPA